MINWFRKTSPETQVSEEVSFSHLKIEPLPFQQEGVRFLQKVNGNAYLGDDPGLGKTFQIIAYTSFNHFKTLVVCPAYLKYNWQNEIEKFTSCSSVIVGTSVPKGNYDYYIVNYELLTNPKVQSFLGKIHLDCMVCDESHYIMNETAKRSIAVNNVGKNIPKKICMSGTPIKSRPEEFFTQLKFLHPEIADFSNERVYKIKYCNEVKTKLGTTNNLAPNSCLTELHQRITPFYIRRTKTEVLKQLPQKTFIPVSLDLPVEFKTDFRNYDNPLKAITEIKVQLSQLKINTVVEHVRNLIDAGQKVIVFSQYVETIDILTKQFEGQCVVHKGSMSALKRQKVIDAFQNDPNTMVLIGNIATAVGYNATVACNVVYVDLPWTPADIIQSTDRVHRIGQTSSVSSYIFFYKGSLEEDIYNLLYEKQKVFEQVVDGKIDTQESMSIMKMIVEKWKAA